MGTESDLAVTCDPSKMTKLPLDQLAHGTGPSAYRDPGCPQALLNSLDRLGQIEPLLVAQRGSHLTLVSGHRRADGLQKLGHSDAWIMPVDAPTDLDILRISVIENSGGIGFNDLERARIISSLVDQCGQNPSTVAQEWLPLLGLDSTTKLVTLYATLGAEKALHPGLRTGSISPGLGTILSGFDREHLPLLAIILEESRLGYSKSRELLHLLDELARRDKLTISELVNDLRGEPLLQMLRRKRYPRLEERRLALQRLNDDLPPWLSFRETSGEGLEARFMFCGNHELGTRLRALQELALAPDTAEIVEIF